MPAWNAPATPAATRVEERHQSVTGQAPRHVADAPGTFIVIGENADHFGGITVVGLAGLRAAVAVSPRTDSKISVDADFAGEHISDVVEGARIAQLGDAGFSAFSAEATEDAPAAQDDAPRGLAVRLGGLVHTLVGRQMLSRDTAGLDITVVADIPLGSGLGALHATDVALGLALLADDADIDTAPLRTRLAEIASQSVKTFSDLPVLRARHSAALRGVGNTVSVVDYADGSLTQAPHPTREGVRILTVAAAFGEPFADESQAVTTGREFIDEACTNFGVVSLRQLPDAAERVVEWVDARRQVHGADSAPTLETARAWVAFSETETQQSADAAKALRSMRPDEFFALIGEPARTPGLPVPDQLVQLLAMRGARAARPAAAGMSQAVLAYIPAKSADNAIADLAADGLAVAEITTGDTARVIN